MKPSKLTFHLPAALGAGIMLFQTPLANAAVITWGTATAISTGTGNSSDVSTNGTLVEAYSGQTGGPSPAAPGDQTVNGVLFKGTAKLLGNTGGFADLSSGTNGGDSSYDNLLSSADYGGGDSITITIGDGDGDSSLTGAGLLAIGGHYEIQIWFVDDRTSPTDTSGRVMGYASSSSDTVVSLNDQFVIGTFTADATTQTLFLDTVSPDTGFGNTHITAYQIRLVPEPSSALLCLGGLGLFLRRRRRKTAQISAPRP